MDLGHEFMGVDPQSLQYHVVYNVWEFLPTFLFDLIVILSKSFNEESNIGIFFKFQNTHMCNRIFISPCRIIISDDK